MLVYSPTTNNLPEIVGSTLICIPQLFSLMLHKNASDKFSFESCKFTIQRSKESTGRFVESWILMMMLRMLVIISKGLFRVVDILLNTSSIQGGLLEHGNHELVHSWGEKPNLWLFLSFCLFANAKFIKVNSRLLTVGPILDPVLLPTSIAEIMRCGVVCIKTSIIWIDSFFFLSLTELINSFVSWFIISESRQTFLRDFTWLQVSPIHMKYIRLHHCESAYV